MWPKSRPALVASRGFSGQSGDKVEYELYMGGCQNYDPFLATLHIRCRIITGIQKGTVLLTSTHISPYIYIYICR